MTNLYKKRFLELQQQMDAILESKESVYNDVYEKHIENIDSRSLLEWSVKAKSLLNKACGIDSEHYKMFSKKETGSAYSTSLNILENLRAIFIAAKEDYEGGYLRTSRSLIQAEVFDSELEQADELLRSGYKLPAAVVAGVVLETSLRELCDQESLPHGKLDKMNSDLTKTGRYNKLQQKRITALADIRNSAAHGKDQNFSTQDVSDMIRDVEKFLAEYL